MDIVEFKLGVVPNANSLWIELPCQPHHDLDWTVPLSMAKESGKKIVWYFNLGLEDPFFPLEDEMRFASIALALQQFTKEVWPNFQEQTLAMSLYKGPLVEFSMYFQMLAHKLPDELPIWLLFDVELTGSLSRGLSSIFTDGFEHFKIALRGKSLPVDGYVWDDEKIVYQSCCLSTGAVFPTNPTAASRFDQLLATEPARVVQEAYLAEQWEGLDRLLVLTDSLTTQGKRMLKGFEAAGGEVVYM